MTLEDRISYLENYLNLSPSTIDAGAERPERDQPIAKPWREIRARRAQQDGPGFDEGTARRERDSTIQELASALVEPGCGCDCSCIYDGPVFETEGPQHADEASEVTDQALLLALSTLSDLACDEDASRDIRLRASEVLLDFVAVRQKC